MRLYASSSMCSPKEKEQLSFLKSPLSRIDIRKVGTLRRRDKSSQPSNGTFRTHAERDSLAVKVNQVSIRWTGRCEEKVISSRAGASSLKCLIVYFVVSSPCYEGMKILL